jgi:hypothetical protein
MVTTISVGNLLLDLNNYRIVKQSSQNGARLAIIEEQGKKLIKLAEDILSIGLSPSDLPMVIEAGDGNQNFIVVEGNRRLTAVQLLLNPELAKDTPLYRAFSKMHKERFDAVPQVMECVVLPDKKTALVWANRKHANGLEGAGTEHWTSMAKARADVDQGLSRPGLDVVEFVLTSPSLKRDLRHFLEGAQFNLTTLDRLVTTKEFPSQVGMSITGGKVVAETDKQWLLDVLTTVVKTIAEGKLGAEPFTERSVDTPKKRETFTAEILSSHAAMKAAKTPWQVAGTAKSIAAAKQKTPKVTSTPTTEELPNVMPKSYRMELPHGKINDIFTELKRLDVIKARHAISVLLRVFIELSLHEYTKFHSVSLPKDAKGRPVEKMSVVLAHVVSHVKSSSLMNGKEMKPIDVAIADPNSVLAPDTLHAYVHSPLMNPDPLRLKYAWRDVQLFLERMWVSMK